VICKTWRQNWTSCDLYHVGRPKAVGVETSDHPVPGPATRLGHYGSIITGPMLMVMRAASGGLPACFELQVGERALNGNLHVPPARVAE
jgi:hypothetical protein